MAQNSPWYVIVALSGDLSERLLEVGAHLERFGYQVGTAATGGEVLTRCGHTKIDAVVFDLPLVEEFGLSTWLDKLKLISPATAPVAIGSVENLETLRQASLNYSGDYALLPLDLGEIRNRVQRLVRTGPLQRPERPDPSAAGEQALADMVGRSPAMQEIRDRIRKVAGLTSNVLITGESGVGKELIARGIHRVSPRHSEPFIALNCSALPESLLESELFGYEKGAFTGATTAGKGKFELAHRGTLFLDEIGDMNPYTQAKILRVLEEREFMRLGGSRNIRVDVRLVAATNADLNKRMAEGSFREDLYYRLKVLTFEVPPLRDRAEDIPELARILIDRFTSMNPIGAKRVTDDALRALQRYRWPGNIRELRNALESAVAMAPGDVVDVEDLPAVVSGGTSAPVVSDGQVEGPPVMSMDEMEQQLIRRVLLEVNGNRTKAARILKIGVRTLQRKIKQYGLGESA